MTLQEFITKYNGKVVADGQCGNLVRAYWNEVDLTNPPSYPNSKDYWFNPVPGYDKVSTPQPGDIAIYNGHGMYTEGHSAIYAGNGQVFEQNADPDGSPAHLFNRANTYLLGYLRKQGGTSMNPTPQQAGDTYKAFATEADGITPGNISQKDLDIAIQTPWAAWIPNFYPGVQTLRNNIKLLTEDRDNNLYPYIEAVTQALGLPSSATKEDCVAAIEKLKAGGVQGIKLTKGNYYVE